VASEKYERIWNAVRNIPRGRVASYGRIATLADLDGHARMVGYALHSLKPASDVPWHRVINAQGRISLPGPIARTQRRLLETEDIKFSPDGRINMKKYGI
jgi:methylated-DNA-protein-cysteine methyltransferase-like protein